MARRLASTELEGSRTLLQYVDAMDGHDDIEEGMDGIGSEAAGNESVDDFPLGVNFIRIIAKARGLQLFLYQCSAMRHPLMTSRSGFLFDGVERRQSRFDSMEVEDAVESALRMQMMKEIDERLTSTTKNGSAKREYSRPFFSREPKSHDDRPLFSGFCCAQVRRNTGPTMFTDANNRASHGLVSPMPCCLVLSHQSGCLAGLAERFSMQRGFKRRREGRQTCVPDTEQLLG